MSVPEPGIAKGDRLGGLPPTVLRNDKREDKQIRGVLCHSWPVLKLQQWEGKGRGETLVSNTGQHCSFSEATTQLMALVAM